jgi:hypothetical protein
MTGPVTIGDLMRDRRLLWVYCRECGRERDLDPATLPLPGDHPVPDVGKRMRCSACGSRKGPHGARTLSRRHRGDADQVGRQCRTLKLSASTGEPSAATVILC